MKPINEKQWQEFSGRTGITMASPAGEFRGELRFIEGESSRLVVHFVDNDVPVRLSKALEALLSVQEGWYLLPTTGRLPFPLYEGEEIPRLKHNLMQELGNLVCKENSFYVIGVSGEVYFSYDHEFLDEGLNIYTRNDGIAESLTALFNDLKLKTESF